MTVPAPATETILIAGYAMVLIVGAFLLDQLARHVQRRSDRHRTAGFRYVPDHDHWVCPTNQPLWPHRIDGEARLVRYRARPSVCNACPAKHDCTTSSSGREITRALDQWPHSEAGRFHRGIALMLVVLAALFVVIGVVSHLTVGDLATLAPVALVCTGAGWVLTGHFRHTPADFPAGIPVSERSSS
ncbi:hypothetical protein JMUB6875_31800 [Nocardia sp. JMUB6875]|uniref:hypothetical protein n=1 Tax=Nocardia sp. JMUB6875 TaxID=3158170 RepID=UPI0032E7DEC8